MLVNFYLLPGQVPQQQGGGPGQLLPAQVAGGVLYPASSFSTRSDTEAYQGIVQCIAMFILPSLPGCTAPGSVVLWARTV